MSELLVAPCSHKAAKFAVEHWHYSERMPSGKLVKLGAWEGGRFIGVVLFGRGSNNNIGQPYGLQQTEMVELVRVALGDHESQVSAIVARSVRYLRSANDGLRLILSYADPAQRHVGTIYQAMNWLYVGTSQPQRELVVDGVWMHKRSASARWGTASPDKIAAMTGANVGYGPIEYKHAYLYPLDKKMRRQIEPLAKPYPKRASGQGDTSATSRAGRFDSDPDAPSANEATK